MNRNIFYLRVVSAAIGLALCSAKGYAQTFPPAFVNATVHATSVTFTTSGKGSVTAACSGTMTTSGGSTPSSGGYAWSVASPYDLNALMESVAPPYPISSPYSKTWTIDTSTDGIWTYTIDKGQVTRRLGMEASESSPGDVYSSIPVSTSASLNTTTQYWVFTLTGGPALGTVKCYVAQEGSYSQSFTLGTGQSATAETATEIEGTVSHSITGPTIGTTTYSNTTWAPDIVTTVVLDGSGNGTFSIPCYCGASTTFTGTEVSGDGVSATTSYVIRLYSVVIQ